jgi:hypothetical protein
MQKKSIVIVSEKYYACGASMAAFRLADGLAESGWDSHFLYNEHNNKGAKPPSHSLQRFHYRQESKTKYSIKYANRSEKHHSAPKDHLRV